MMKLLDEVQYLLATVLKMKVWWAAASNYQETYKSAAAFASVPHGPRPSKVSGLKSFDLCRIQFKTAANKRELSVSPLLRL